MFLMSNEVLNLAVKMSISSAKRMGDVATVYDTKSKKVITHSVKKRLIRHLKIKELGFQYNYTSYNN